MTTTTTTQAIETSPETKRSADSAPAPKATGNKYPFRTKADILLQLQTDDTFVVEAMGILYQRQTTDEQETRETKYKNRRGFMSSHAVNGTRLVEKMMAGEEWTDEDWSKARGIVSRYGKQLASHFRQEALDANPALKAQSACFFKPQG